MFRYLIHPTGGLHYHWNAWKYKNKLWKSFQKSIENWLLQEWNPSSDELVLIGPSAGYQLPLVFLKKFKKIIFYEQDAIAAYLLKRKLKKNKILFEANEKSISFFVKNKLSLEGMIEIQKQHPDAAFLFCNVLGQLPILKNQIEEQKWIEWSHALEVLFEKNDWASFHDVFSSTHNTPSVTKLKVTGLERKKLLKNEFLKKIFLSTDKIEVVDHQFFSCFSEKNIHFFYWNLKPKTHHVVAGVTHQFNKR